MATTDTILSIDPLDFFPANAGNPSGGEFGRIASGLIKGLGFAGGVTTRAYIAKRLPANASLATGATFKLLISDDVNQPCPSAVIKLGVNAGVLGTSGAYVAPATAAMGTEATGTVTLPSTSGQTIEVSIPIVVANMANCAASKWALLSIGRIGLDAADTGRNGRIIIHGVSVLDT